MSEKETKKETVGIIGTGNYGISVGKRLLSSGFRLVYGSRNPDLNYLKESFSNVRNKNFHATNIAEAFQQADRFVIFAVSAYDSVYESIVDNICKSLAQTEKRYSASKIVIEISNLLDEQAVGEDARVSHAEKLQNLFRTKLEENNIHCEINVCKGFNLTSAYSLSESVDNLNKQALTSKIVVPIAGDNIESKEKVVDLCNRIGVSGYDFGSLSEGALKLEMSNKQIFNEWYYPSLLCFGFFIFNFVWIFANYFYFPKKLISLQQYLNDFSLLSHTNKVLGYTALQLLGFVYFATAIASIYQLAYGTKYKKFPKYLDSWLKTRKQFGLLAFFLSCIHAVATIYVMNPQYLSDWYRVPDRFSNLKILTLNGELALLLGILSFAFLVIIALTSISSIGNGLTFGEWRFVQSNLGIVTLSLGTLHTIVMYLRIYNEKDKFNYSLTYLLTRVKLIACFFPLFVLFVRFLLGYCPPLAKRIEKIRQGTINCRAKASNADKKL